MRQIWATYIRHIPFRRRVSGMERLEEQRMRCPMAIKGIGAVPLGSWGLAMNWVVQTPMSTDPLASHPMCPPDLAFRGRLSAQGWAREERTRFFVEYSYCAR